MCALCRMHWFTVDQRSFNFVDSRHADNVAAVHSGDIAHKHIPFIKWQCFIKLYVIFSGEYTSHANCRFFLQHCLLP